jgi:phosphatidylinositol phospholipase C beta
MADTSAPIQNGFVEPELFTFDRFYTLCTKICPRIDVMDIFQRMSTDKLYITCDKLIEFLNEVWSSRILCPPTRGRLLQDQRDPRLNEILFPFFTPSRIQTLIMKYDPDAEARASGGEGGLIHGRTGHCFNFISDKLSFDGFLRYLISDENAPVFLNRVDLFQDMDQPLAHYYINR